MRAMTPTLRRAASAIFMSGAGKFLCARFLAKNFGEGIGDRIQVEVSERAFSAGDGGLCVAKGMSLHPAAARWLTRNGFKALHIHGDSWYTDQVLYIRVFELRRPLHGMEHR